MDMLKYTATCNEPEMKANTVKHNLHESQVGLMY